MPGDRIDLVDSVSGGEFWGLIPCQTAVIWHLDHRAAEPVATVKRIGWGTEHDRIEIWSVARAIPVCVSYFTVPSFMPVGKLPSVDRLSSTPTTTPGLSLLRAGGIHVRISYSIVVGTIGLALAAFAGSRWPGNADLPRAIGAGALFWLSGWVVQSASFLVLSRVLGSSTRQLCLGVLGVETGPRYWPASRALGVAGGSIVALILLGIGYQMFGGGFHLPQTVRPGQSPWAAPSLGLTKHDTLWKSGAWLCWLQAAFQLYPVPRTLGRQMLGALASLGTQGKDPSSQATIFRHALSLVALLTMGLTVALVLRVTTFLGVPWMVFFLLSVLLWISSRGNDVELILLGHRSPSDESTPAWLETPRGASWVGHWSRLRSWAREKKMVRRLRMAQQKEWNEAVDAERLDEILGRLQDDGIDALSSDDRRILDRVSQRLRRRREHQAEDEDSLSD